MMPAETLRAALAWTVVESPLGPLTLVGDHDGLHAVYFQGRSGPLDEDARDASPFVFRPYAIEPVPDTMTMPGPSPTPA